MNDSIKFSMLSSRFAGIIWKVMETGLPMTYAYFSKALNQMIVSQIDFNA